VNSKINGNQPYFYGNYQTEPEQNKKAEQKTEQPKEKKGGSGFLTGALTGLAVVGAATIAISKGKNPKAAAQAIVKEMSGEATESIQKSGKKVIKRFLRSAGEYKGKKVASKKTSKIINGIEITDIQEQTFEKFRDRVAKRLGQGASQQATVPKSGKTTKKVIEEVFSGAKKRGSEAWSSVKSGTEEARARAKSAYEAVKSRAQDFFKKEQATTLNTDSAASQPFEFKIDSSIPSLPSGKYTKKSMPACDGWRKIIDSNGDEIFVRNDGTMSALIRENTVTRVMDEKGRWKDIKVCSVELNNGKTKEIHTNI